MMGENMNNRVNVLDVYVDDCSAKEAVKMALEFLRTDPISIVEMVTVDGCMSLNDQAELKKEMQSFDLVLAADVTILKTAPEFLTATEHEVKKHIFLKLLLQYLHKNKKRVYMLVGDQEDGQNLLEYMERRYKGIVVTGMAKIVPEDRIDDRLVNAINGTDTECIISVLSAPLQEEFIARNRSLLNPNLWLGVGTSILPYMKEVTLGERIGRFIIRKLFQRKVKEEK